MDSDHHLPTMLLGERPKQCREVGNMDVIHRLHGIIEDHPWESSRYGEMERREQRQCSGIKISCTQHCTRRSPRLATISVFGDELGLKLLGRRFWDSERWNEGLFWRQPYEQVAPHPIEPIIKLSSNDRGAYLVDGVANCIALITKNLGPA